MSGKNLRRLVRTVVSYMHHPIGVTCSDCGFLAIDDKELTTADRLILQASGPTVGFAGGPPIEKIWCFRSLWIEYDLAYVAPCIEAIFDEIHQQRRGCEGFLAYKPGWSPAGHQDLLLKGIARREKIFFVVLGWILGVLGTLLMKFLGLY
jgi:hypothetical protein